MYGISLLTSDGQVVASEVLAATDDAQAVMKADAYLRQHPTIPGLEVWRDGCLVHRIHQPTTPSAQPPRRAAS